MMIFPEHNGVNPVVAEVVRSGLVESRHRGAVAGLAADGTQVISAGDTAVPFFPRSANKPLQATAMLRAGAELDGELLALAAASHSGEDYHVDGVRKILSGAGLTEADLGCPPSWPLDQEPVHLGQGAGVRVPRGRVQIDAPCPLDVITRVGQLAGEGLLGGQPADLVATEVP